MRLLTVIGIVLCLVLPARAQQTLDKNAIIKDFFIPNLEEIFDKGNIPYDHEVFPDLVLYIDLKDIGKRIKLEPKCNTLPDETIRCSGLGIYAEEPAASLELINQFNLEIGYAVKATLVPDSSGGGTTHLSSFIIAEEGVTVGALLGTISAFNQSYRSWLAGVAKAGEQAP